MINIWEVNETNKMIEHENLDVRTITLGISLLDCIDTDLAKVNENIYRKITTVAKDLVKVGKEIENKYCIPIVNKRISITPISLIGASACKTPEDYVTIAKTLDDAAREVGVNFIGGFSALVQKGMTDGEIARRIGKLFDLRPAAIVRRFGLKNPIFEATASYGHFGNRPYTERVKVWENGRETEREIEFFGWEKLDAVEQIKREFGL